MNKTELIYQRNMNQLEANAQVLEAINNPDGTVSLTLNKTVFYPQGGGQPTDRGLIKGSNSSLKVESVRNNDGVVSHTGILESGTFTASDTVQLIVDAQIRKLHNRNHTAGHLIDYALHKLGFNLVSGKGYHFPQGPYVEYEGTLEQDIRDKLKTDLEQEVNQLIAQAIPVKIEFLSQKELVVRGQSVPPHLLPHEDVRVMYLEGFSYIPCGGTHVGNSSEIGGMTIRKIKNEKGFLRISYAVN
jgi:Ser-tRNA(Ala) deacylase AlaX